MPYTLDCPHCGREVTLPRTWRVNCPLCRRRINMPAPAVDVLTARRVERMHALFHLGLMLESLDEGGDRCE